MAHGINWYETIDSTNSEALRCIETANDFTAYAAIFQTSGRGQKGNSWESEAGKNLTFSILIKPVLLQAQDQFLVSQIVALGIVDYLNSHGLTAKIKWPNDIYIGNKKICGILIEHYLSGANLSASIIGIGLNLNQRIFASNAPNPTSLSLETGNVYDPKLELELLLAFVKEYYDELNVRSYNAFQKRTGILYHNNLYRLMEFAKYQECGSGDVIEAKITGVDNCACLVLEKKDGSTKHYAFKEIKYILNL